MTTALAPRRAPSARSAPPVAPQEAPEPSSSSVLLQGVSWETYEALCEDLDGTHIRLTYDQGSLEIMTLSFEHERSGGVLGRLVDVLAEELGIDYISAWSTTFKRKDVRKGLEGDRTFYIQRVAAVAGKLKLDLKIDPPPDLAVEVDVTSSSLNRMGIYGALGVPAVWRYDGKQFQVFQRKRDGSYRSVPRSKAFPTLPVAEVLPLLRQVTTLTELAMIRALRVWVREHVVPKS